MKHLEIITCKPRRWQLPWLTKEGWKNVTIGIFLFGLSAGILLGSWYNNMILQAIANK